MHEKRWATFQRETKTPRSQNCMKFGLRFVTVFGKFAREFFLDTKDGFGGRHGVTVGDLPFRVDSPSTTVDG